MIFFQVIVKAHTSEIWTEKLRFSSFAHKDPPGPLVSFLFNRGKKSSPAQMAQISEITDPSENQSHPNDLRLDSSILKLSYLFCRLKLFQLKTLPVKKNAIVEVGEFQPRSLPWNPNESTSLATNWQMLSSMWPSKSNSSPRRRMLS